MAYLLIATVTIAQVITNRSRKTRGCSQRFGMPMRTRVTRLAIALLPSLLLAILFVSRQGISPENDGAVSIVKRLAKLLTLYSLVLFEHAEVVLSTLTAVLLFGLALWQVRSRFARWKWRDALVVVCAECIAAVLIAPDRVAGGGMLVDRLVLFPFFALVLWLATCSFARSLRVVLQTSVTTLVCAFLIFRMIGFARVDPYLREFMSAGAYVQPNTTLLVLPFSDRIISPNGRVLSFRIFPLNHAAGLLAENSGAVDLANYEASLSYFPVRFRPGRSLAEGVSRLREMDEVPKVSFEDYHHRTGGAVDYVLIWNRQPKHALDPAAVSIFAQLEAHYKMIYVSPQAGNVQLYQRRDFKAN